MSMCLHTCLPNLNEGHVQKKVSSRLWITSYHFLLFVQLLTLCIQGLFVSTASIIFSCGLFIFIPPLSYNHNIIHNKNNFLFLLFYNYKIHNRKTFYIPPIHDKTKSVIAPIQAKLHKSPINNAVDGFILAPSYCTH